MTAAKKMMEAFMLTQTQLIKKINDNTISLYITSTESYNKLFKSWNINLFSISAKESLINIINTNKTRFQLNWKLIMKLLFVK